MPDHDKYNFHPYPGEFPRGVTTLVVDALRGGEVCPKGAAHAAWHLAGFGLSQWDDHSPAVVVSGAEPNCPECTDEEAAQMLEDCCPNDPDCPEDECEGDNKPQLSGGLNINWARLLPVLLSLIERLARK